MLSAPLYYQDVPELELEYINMNDTRNQSHQFTYRITAGLTSIGILRLC